MSPFSGSVGAILSIRDPQQLLSHLTYGNIVMPAVFEEFKREAAWLREQKIDFSFLAVFND